MGSKLILTFGGMRPILSARLLPEEPRVLAQTATNCNLESGNLKAMKGVTEVSDLGAGTEKTLWLTGSNWRTFGANIEASVVDSWIDESKNQIFYTGDSYPKLRDDDDWPSTDWGLGVVKPTAAPSITINGSAGDDIQEIVSYVYTMVTSDGFESAPSPATAVTTIYTGQYVSLSDLDTPAGGRNDYSYKRIYRLAAGTVGADYQFLKQIASSGSTADDGSGTELDTVETSVLQTEDWEVPPDSMANLTAGHNGMIFGSDGKEVYVSETFIPYAYKPANVITLDTACQGIGATDEFVLAVSKTRPYIITGSDPESLVSVGQPINQTCLSHRGIASDGTGLLFPSAEGICRATMDGVQLITGDIITPEQWAVYTAYGTILGEWWDGAYYMFFSGSYRGLRFTPSTGELIYFELPTTTDLVYDTHVDKSDDTLHILIRDTAGDNKIYSWETNSTKLTCTWASKKFINKHQYTAAKVQAEFGTVTFKYYAGGSLLQTTSVTSDEVFRLAPAPYHEEKYVEVSGTVDIHSIHLAESPEELL